MEASGKEEVTLPLARGVLYTHEEEVAQWLVELWGAPLHFLHISRRGWIGKVSSSRGEVCLKGYLSRHWYRARRAFGLSWQLLRSGVPIPPPLGFWLEKGWLWRHSLIFSEYLEGYELRWHLLEHCPQSEEEWQTLFESLLEVLLPLFLGGFCHRDLSPHNFLICAGSHTPWRAYLLDWEDVKRRTFPLEKWLFFHFSKLSDMPGCVPMERRFQLLELFCERLPQKEKATLSHHRWQKLLSQIRQYVRWRQERRVKRDGWDWMQDLEALPGRGPVPRPVPKPTIPPPHPHLPVSWQTLWNSQEISERRGAS